MSVLGLCAHYINVTLPRVCTYLFLCVPECARECGLMGVYVCLHGLMGLGLQSLIYDVSVGSGLCISNIQLWVWFEFPSPSTGLQVPEKKKKKKETKKYSEPGGH